ncbi:MAG: type II secretion system protein, partial [Thermogutta sp.]
GFTLVEMLTVIVIIGILAGLISAAAIYARARAREAAIYTQIKQLEASLMQYKNEYGEFPPDFSGPDRKFAIERHIRRRWPRFTIHPSVGSSPTPLYDTLKIRLQNEYNIDLDSLDARSALVFWLGGLPDIKPEQDPFLPLRAVYKPVGFHADEANPIQRGEPRTGKFYEFDPTEIEWSGPGNPPLISLIAFVPDTHIASDQIPCIVYFRSDRASDGSRTYATKANLLTVGCVPYRVSTNENWRNPDSFQLIHPGLDGDYGGPRQVNPGTWPVSDNGVNFTQGDYDNITNFAPKLESEIQ